MQIHDAILFYNELELLEIRLQELVDVVDRFLIVEATRTFRGKPKDLVFARARDRFSAFDGRLDYLIVDDLPADGDAWGRETHQRNAIARGLAGVGREDIVMISDADEIPTREAVIRLRKERMLPAGFVQPVHYGWLDVRAKTPESHLSWVGTRAMWGGSLTPQELRLLRKDLPALIRPGGWHFSYLGGADRVADKLSAYAHVENDRPEIKSAFHSALREGKDPFERENYSYEQIPVSVGNHPLYVVENQQRFRHLLLGDPPTGREASGVEQSGAPTT